MTREIFGNARQRNKKQLHPLQTPNNDHATCLFLTPHSRRKITVPVIRVPFRVRLAMSVSSVGLETGVAAPRSTTPQCPHIHEVGKSVPPNLDATAAPPADAQPLRPKLRGHRLARGHGTGIKTLILLSNVHCRSATGRAAKAASSAWAVPNASSVACGVDPHAPRSLALQTAAKPTANGREARNSQRRIMR
jgi:hypothetical protein